jgi:hypothetical protein
MADTCNDKLSKGFVKKCAHKPKQGIKRKWYFNIDDIDKTATQLANRGTKVTALVLNAGAKVYAAEGNNKTSKANHALVVGDHVNGYIHTDNFTVLYRGEEERERIQELVDGGKVGVIVEKVDTGAQGELSYEILGLESGMAITEDNWSSSENGGATLLTVATMEGEEEGTGAKLWIDTDLATTVAWIAANEYAAVE